MKFLFNFIFLFLFTFGNAQGISFFKGTFEEAKLEAKKQDKLIFMDAYASWCGPCKRMAKNVFPKKEAGDFFNENFINVKMDMEKGEGKKLSKKYGVRSYPTLLFLDHTGDVVYKTKGARKDARSLVALGKKALKPSKNVLASLQKQWDSGDRNKTFLMKFIKVKSSMNSDTDDAMEAFLSQLSDEEKINESNLHFIFNNTNSITSPSLSFIKSNKKIIKNSLGEKVFDDKINKIAFNAISKSKDNKNIQINDIKSLLKSFKPKGFQKQMSFIETKYYGLNKDWNNYDKAVTKYLNKYKKGDDNALKNVAWNYYMNIDDTKKLLKAEKWTQKAIKINNSYKNNLTQSYLLYKLEKYNQAQDAVEYALILAKDSSARTKNAEILKKKIDLALKGEKKPVVLDYKVK